MVIDSSALIAILTNEPDADSLRRVIDAEPLRQISAISYLEAIIVLQARKGVDSLGLLEELLDGASIRIVPFSAAHARRAFQAHQRFGKGHHPARLNLGDCAVYALAASVGEPVLCKGNDFRQTDIPCVP